MAVKQYEVEIGGVVHTLQLDAEDVKRYPGAKEVTAKAADAPANKARKPANKSKG